MQSSSFYGSYDDVNSMGYSMHDYPQSDSMEQSAFPMNAPPPPPPEYGDGNHNNDAIAPPSYIESTAACAAGNKPNSVNSRLSNFRHSRAGVLSPSKGPPIDVGRYRTRMCRNYLMGAACPFEESCAFAHGEEQLRCAAEGGQLRHSGSMDQLSCADEEEFYAAMAAPPPPSYEETTGAVAHTSSMDINALSVVTGTNSIGNSAINSPAELSPRGSTPPPAYPKKFRYDPYSSTGIFFERDI